MRKAIAPSSSPLSPQERVALSGAKGRVKGMILATLAPHPPLRGTFSRREKGDAFIRNSKFLILVFVLGCGSFHRTIGTSQSPATPWTAPADVVPPATPQSRSDLVLPPNFTPGMAITLAQVVDLALANNTATRIAWLQAR